MLPLRGVEQLAVIAVVQKNVTFNQLQHMGQLKRSNGNMALLPLRYFTADVTSTYFTMDIAIDYP